MLVLCGFGFLESKAQSAFTVLGKTELTPSLSPLAEQLQAFKKPYSLIVYDEPSHSLPFKHLDSFERMFQWFEKHKMK
jgi:hypothetical protein